MTEARLLPLPGGWSTSTLNLSGTELKFSSPTSPDLLLDDPAVHDANQVDDYMPYWAFTWQSSTRLAEAILLAPQWPSGTEALELGCGLGLSGLAALVRGLTVTFSDYEPAAVDAALFNAHQNGFHAEGLTLDWRDPVSRQFPVILAADILYESRNHEPVLNLLDQMLSPRGIALFGDPGRRIGIEFCTQARQHGYEVELTDQSGNPLPEFTPGEFLIIQLTPKG